MSDTAEVKSANMETISALPPEETERLGGEIVAALKTVFDPEIPADIYELGLIYKVDLKDDRSVDVMMTLTTPNCPAAGELPTMNRITANDHNQSYLWHKINGTQGGLSGLNNACNFNQNQQMPPPSGGLSATEISDLTSWIDTGAQP